VRTAASIRLSWGQLVRPSQLQCNELPARASKTRPGCLTLSRGVFAWKANRRRHSGLCLVRAKCHSRCLRCLCLMRYGCYITVTVRDGPAGASKLRCVTPPFRGRNRPSRPRTGPGYLTLSPSNHCHPPLLNPYVPGPCANRQDLLCGSHPSLHSVLAGSILGLTVRPDLPRAGF